jgi:hypothetical protein
MTIHQLTVDVYARWSEVAPRYRIMVDGDLLTERDFVFPGTERFVRENIVVELDPGTHKLVVEKVSGNGTVRLERITLDGVASDLVFDTQ